MRGEICIVGCLCSASRLSCASMRGQDPSLARYTLNATHSMLAGAVPLGSYVPHVMSLRHTECSLTVSWCFMHPEVTIIIREGIGRCNLWLWYEPSSFSILVLKRIYFLDMRKTYRFKTMKASSAIWNLSHFTNVLETPYPSDILDFVRVSRPVLLDHLSIMFHSYKLIIKKNLFCLLFPFFLPSCLLLCPLPLFFPFCWLLSMSVVCFVFCFVFLCFPC